MYIGDGRMVHAMSPRYGVQVSGVWNDYWTSRYAGAIRVRR
jgi:cell wall-associated NlpC family hydrolase